MEANVVTNKVNPNDITLDELEKVGSQQYSLLNLNDVLDYIAPEDLMQKLFNIKSKLKQGGKIIIQSFDLFELANAISDDKLPTVEFNNIIKNRKQLLTVPDLTFILNKLNFKILSKDIDAFKLLIEAQNVN